MRRATAGHHLRPPTPKAAAAPLRRRLHVGGAPLRPLRSLRQQQAAAALSTRPRRCLHTDDGAAAALLKELGAEAYSSPPVFNVENLHAVVELVDELDAAPPWPRPLHAAPPPLALGLGHDGDAEADAGAEAESALAQLFATWEAELGGHIISVVAAAPGEPEDRAEMLALLAQALADTPWLSGQLLTAVARVEAAATGRRGRLNGGGGGGGGSLAATANLLEDWLVCAVREPADSDAAGLTPVLLSVLETAARTRDTSLAWRVLAQLRQHSGNEQQGQAPLAAYKLILTMAAQSSSVDAAKKCLAPVRADFGSDAATPPDAEFQTLLFRAEVAALPAAAMRKDAAPLKKLAAERVSALVAAGLNADDALFLSWVDAHSEAGHFSKAYMGVVDSVLKGVKAATPAGEAPPEHVCAALLAATLRNPSLKPRDMKKRQKVIESKLTAVGWGGHTEQSYTQLVKALVARRGGATAALNVLKQMREHKMEPSAYCYGLVVKSLLKTAGGAKHEAAPWSAVEIAALRLATARHVRDPTKKFSQHRGKRARHGEERHIAGWQQVAEEVGTGRSWWSCHKRWAEVSVSMGLLGPSPAGFWAPVLDDGASEDEPKDEDERELAALEVAMRHKYGNSRGAVTALPTSEVEAAALSAASTAAAPADVVAGPVQQKLWGLKTAINCLGQMAREGQAPPLYLCNAVLSSCVTHFRPWLALSVLEDMKKWGVDPDETSLVSPTLPRRTFPLLLDWFLTGRSSRGGSQHYLVQACIRVKVGFTGKAIKLLDDIPLAPKDETWVLLIGACLASEHPRAWEAVVAVADRAVAAKVAEVRTAQTENHQRAPSRADWLRCSVFAVGAWLRIVCFDGRRELLRPQDEPEAERAARSDRSYAQQVNFLPLRDATACDGPRDFLTVCSCAHVLLQSGAARFTGVSCGDGTMGDGRDRPAGLNHFKIK